MNETPASRLAGDATITPGRVPGGYREVWSLAYPAMLTMMAQTVLAFTDAIMVSRLGDAEIAAVGFAGTILWGLFSFFHGNVTAVNTFVAQDYGSENHRHIGLVTWQGLYIALVAGVTMLVVREFRHEIFALLGPSPQVQELGSLYIGVRLLGTLPVMIGFCIAAYLRGLGDTRTPLYVVAFVNAINILGDYVLIFGHWGFPRLEVTGAALATLFANAVGAIIFLSVFLRPTAARLFDTRRSWRFVPREMRRLIRIGIPTGVHHAMDMGSFIVFSAIIGRVSTTDLAANEITIRLMSISFMPAYGISMAATTLVGQYVGSKRLPYAVRSGYTAMKLSLIYTGLVSAAFVLIPESILSLFDPSPEVMAKGVIILMLAAAFQMFDGVGIVSGGALRGAGDAAWPMYVGVSYAWFLFVPLAYVGGITLGKGAVGAWVGATIYIILLGLTLFYRFRRGTWKYIKI